MAMPKIKEEPVSVVKLVKSKDRVRDVGEVFTPDFLVEQMLDLFPRDAWNHDKNWLEPTCGNGQFIIAVLRRKITYGASLLEALNTTFGADIMKDNVSDCHRRIYTEIVLPWWNDNKVYGGRKRRMRTRVVHMVEYHIRHTKDSLQENFGTWQHFDDAPAHIRGKIEQSVEKALDMVDGVIAPYFTNRQVKRLYSELLPLRIES